MAESTLRTILVALGTAPDSQLRADYRDRARDMAEAPATTDEEIRAFFVEIYGKPDVASRFVLALVDPKHTRAYS